MSNQRFEYPDHANDGSSNWQDTMQAAMEHPVETAEECVASNPLAAVGITMAAGFVGGLLVAGMMADVARTRRRTPIQRATDRASRVGHQAADRAGDLLGDITASVRTAVTDALPDTVEEVIARFR